MMKIGFIGLGIMGSAMCENLVKKSGCPVTAFDLNPDALKQLAAAGAIPLASSRAVAQDADVIFSMVPKTEHVEAVYAEMLPVMRAGQIYVDMSTISPAASAALSVRVKEAGAVMLDAPVVKSRPAAVQGKLGIYVGGDQTAYETVLPLLLCMGEHVIRLGGNGNGLIMKLCHNAMVAQIQNGVNETLSLAQRTAGIDPLTFAEAISYGGGQNFYLDSKKNAIANRDFTTAFSIENMYKDAHLASDLCADCGFDAPGIALSQTRYDTAMARGLGKQDFSATYLLVDKEA